MGIMVGLVLEEGVRLRPRSSEGTRVPLDGKGWYSQGDADK